MSDELQHYLFWKRGTRAEMLLPGTGWFWQFMLFIVLFTVLPSIWLLRKINPGLIFNWFCVSGGFPHHRLGGPGVASLVSQLVGKRLICFLVWALILTKGIAKTTAGLLRQDCWIIDLFTKRVPSDTGCPPGNNCRIIDSGLPNYCFFYRVQALETTSL